ILGVYLAGYISFQRTLDYDRYQKAQQRLDLLTAIQGELKKNIAFFQEFSGQIDEIEAGTKKELLDEWVYSLPELQLFIWQTAGRSSSAFDVPPQILSDLNSLYGAVGKMLIKAQKYGASNIARPTFLDPTTGGTYQRKQFSERLGA